MPDSAVPKKSPFVSPPLPLVVRKATVQLGVTNTIRFPGDLEHKDPSPWFVSSSPHAPTEGNDVQFLVDGSAAIPAMAAAIEATGSNENDYVFMLNWFADAFLSIPGRDTHGIPGGDTLGALLCDKLKNGVQVRGMFWKNPADSSQNRDLVDLLNKGFIKKDDPQGEPFAFSVGYLPEGTPEHSKRKGAAVWDERLNRIELGVQLAVDPFTGQPMNASNPIVLTVGSHHQKVLCVKAGKSLVTFCGGIDFNPDRLAMVFRTYHGAPLHDVHCRVVGPASANILQTFVDRWMDHPDARVLDAETGEGLRVFSFPANSDDLDPGKQDKTGRLSAQIGRTFGAGPLMPGGSALPEGPSDEHYSFAPSGEKTGAELIKNAILNAKKFIYIEDQYFVSMEAAQLLVQALQNGVAHVTIVLPHHCIGDLPLMVRHRRQCIKALKDVDAARVRIFYKCTPGVTPRKAQSGLYPEENAASGGYHTYVHSKLTIVDDMFAIVGSLNYNRRSWGHDSEICIGTYDPSSDKVLTSRFAHWLRMRMWAEHLFGTVVPPSDPGGPSEIWDGHYAELFDGVAAGVHWVELLELEKAHAADGKNYDQSKYNDGATVRPYDTNATDAPQEIFPLPDLKLYKALGGLADAAAWDTLLDPGGGSAK